MQQGGYTLVLVKGGRRRRAEGNGNEVATPSFSCEMTEGPAVKTIAIEDEKDEELSIILPVPLNQAF